MSMSRKGFEAIAATIKMMKVHADAGSMTLEEFRQVIGKELMDDCHRAYTGSSSFDRSRFRAAAELDD